METSSRARGHPIVDEVTAAVSQLLFKIHELETILNSFDGAPSTQEALDQRLSEYQRTLFEMRERLRAPPPDPSMVDPKLLLKERRVPEGLLRSLDAGMNPDEYIRTAFLEAKRDNQISKGKVEAINTLRLNILHEANVAFPEATQEYLKLTPNPSTKPAP